MNKRFLQKGIAILISILCIAYIGNILFKQASANPHNPIEGVAENVSTVPLRDGSSQEDKEEEEKSEDEENHEEEQEEKKENEEKKEINEIDNEKEEDNKEDKEERTEATQDNTLTDNKKDNDKKKDPDSSNIVIIRPEDKDENKKPEINEYFTTTIKDNEIVTREDYSFSIIQKNHDLKVKNTEVYLNNKLIKDFNKSIKLEEGKNSIRIKITYEDENKKSFTVSRTYSVYYNIEDIIIQTSLKDGMKVTVPELSFTAYAEKGKEEIPVSVEYNGNILESEDKDIYNIELKEGENKVAISAKDSDGNSETETFIINYVKHYEELTIITDLKSYQEVREGKFKFNAVGRIRDRRVDLTATLHGKPIEGDKDGNYSIDLIEGSNFIMLTVSDGEDTKTEQYEIMYEYRPEEEDENWEDPYLPIIDTDLKDGITVKSNKLNIWVRAKDYNGNRLDASHIEVKANSEIVPINWTDGDQTSYTIPIINGNNQILISVWDNENNFTMNTYYINGIVKEDGEVIGHATMSIEASTVGLGYLIPPTKVEIHQGEPASYVLDRLLKSKGFNYGMTGSLDSDFYLKYIEREGLVSNPSIPGELDKLLQESSFGYYPEDYQVNRLEEFDFSSGSGWMYSVNGNYPNYGFADKFLVDGEEVRIRYTLSLGRDIGGSDGFGGDGGANWGDW